MTRYSKTPVGAHYGLGDWLLQRLTAVVMAVYTVVAALRTWHPPMDTRMEGALTCGFFRPDMLFSWRCLPPWSMRDILMD